MKWNTSDQRKVSYNVKRNFAKKTCFILNGQRFAASTLEDFSDFLSCCFIPVRNDRKYNVQGVDTPQQGQTKPLMFSIIPITGRCIFVQKLSSFFTVIVDTSCGVVTIMAYWHKCHKEIKFVITYWNSNVHHQVLH